MLLERKASRVVRGRRAALQQIMSMPVDVIYEVRPTTASFRSIRGERRHVVAHITRQRIYVDLSTPGTEGSSQFGSLFQAPSLTVHEPTYAIPVESRTNEHARPAVMS